MGTGNYLGTDGGWSSGVDEENTQTPRVWAGLGERPSSRPLGWLLAGLYGLDGRIRASMAEAELPHSMSP